MTGGAILNSNDLQLLPNPGSAFKAFANERIDVEEEIESDLSRAF